jgi:hypothetical protein
MMQTNLRWLVAALSAALLLAAPAHAQNTAPAYQQPPSVDLAAQESSWRVEESWNEDDLSYLFRRDGSFISSSGAAGRWLQTGNRIVMDWPSYGAVYIGTMSGDRVIGVGYFDDGSLIGAFVLTRER